MFEGRFLRIEALFFGERQNSGGTFVDGSWEGLSAVIQRGSSLFPKGSQGKSRRVLAFLIVGEVLSIRFRVRRRAQVVPGAGGQSGGPQVPHAVFFGFLGVGFWFFMSHQGPLFAKKGHNESQVEKCYQSEFVAAGTSLTGGTGEKFDFEEKNGAGFRWGAPGTFLAPRSFPRGDEFRGRSWGHGFPDFSAILDLVW